MPERNPLVSIIIVNWNGRQYLSECFSSLKKQEYTDTEVIFVDNASTDDSVEFIRKHYPRTKIIENTKNLGFAGANNIGFHQAKGELVLFLNNDTRVTKTFLTELVRVVLSSPKIAGAQGKMLLMDQPERLDSVGAYLTRTGFLYHYGLAKKRLCKVWEVDSDSYSQGCVHVVSPKSFAGSLGRR
jgi:GT2 family glycosyltransferase